MALNGELSRQLRWRCRRGLLEVDLLLDRFARAGLDGLEAGQVDALVRLLGQADQDLLEWLLGRGRPADPELADVVDRIRSAPAA